jgi:hypothetical protein
MIRRRVTGAPAAVVAASGAKKSEIRAGGAEFAIRQTIYRLMR